MIKPTKPIEIPFKLVRGNTKSLSEQICDTIRQKAIKNQILSGSRLPPSRTLALELGVSRSTVTDAYEQLIAEGYVYGKQGSGYILTNVSGTELANTQPPPLKKKLKHKRNNYNASLADMRLFPYQKWAKSISKICRNEPQQLLEGGDLFGNLNLRDEIASHLDLWRAISVDAEQIIITAGATDALEMCIRTLCKFGDVISMEDPGYLPLRKLVTAMGMSPYYISVDSQGTKLPNEPLTQHSMTILTPSHQYPLGMTMSIQRRRQFIHWAKETNSWLIEDDYDSEFRYSGKPIPALASLDKNRTLYIGSFSKIFLSHMRIGYLVIPKSLTVHFQHNLKIFSAKASYLPQKPLANFMTNGDFYRHIRRVRKVYNERRSYLSNRLKLEFSEFGQAIDYHTGMQLVFRMKPNWLDTLIVNEMYKQGFDITALSSFYAKFTPLNGLVLGYSSLDINQLNSMLNQLKKLLESTKYYLDNTP